MSIHSSMRACPSHRAYGLDCDQYDQLLAAARDRCQICKSDYALVIDHDHGVGAWAVRGILCAQCNATLYGRTGKAVARYLANPWYAANPGHPVIPTPRPRTERAKALYGELDRLTRAFNAATRLARPEIRRLAEKIGLALLGEKEGSAAICSRAPFSNSHFRKVARQSGLPPARKGTRIVYKQTPPAVEADGV